MTIILRSIWRLIRGPFQWRVLYLFHAKFIVGVTGICCNSNGEILVLRHQFWPKNSWGFPSGYVRRNETVEAALSREVMEETGYTLGNVRVLRVTSGFRLRLEVYLTATVLGGVEKIDSTEVLEARFARAGDLPSGLLPSHKDALALAIESDALQR